MIINSVDFCIKIITIYIGNWMHLSAIKEQFMSNNQVITQGEAGYNFECLEYNYSLIALKYMRLPTNHIALPMTLYPKHILLPYLSIIMHFIQYQHGTISFTGYYVIACHT